MPRINRPAVFRTQFLRDGWLCWILILTAAVWPRAVAAETDGTPLTPAPLPRSTGGEGAAQPRIRVGIAEADITPPAGFPMAGYYHERLAEGVIDPLHAKAIVVCDLIGIATDLKNEVRRRASKLTGIPPEHIGISATHTHTAPEASTFRPAPLTS